MSESTRKTKLTPDTSLEEFRDRYWYLQDLVEFCRDNGLPAGGQKHELVDRIETFLKTGKREVRRKGSGGKIADSDRGLITLDSVATENYKSDDPTRDFFKSVIGDHFHFSAYLNQWRKQRLQAGEVTTYGDLVKEWLAEQERRKDPNYKSSIHRSWQYNQFVRDFMADKERNAGKGMGEAAKAWTAIRKHSGPHSYEEYVRLKLGGGKP